MNLKKNAFLPSVAFHEPLSFGLLLWMGLVYISFHCFSFYGEERALFHVATFLVLTFSSWAIVRLQSQASSSFFFLCCLFLALLVRLHFLFEHPSMSDDAFRYLWDGKMIFLGLNPFSWVPNDLFLSPYRDTIIHPFINHADYHTIYPPLAQLVYYLSYVWDAQSFQGLKIFLLVAEVSTWWILYLWLEETSLPKWGLLAFILCPLPVFELQLDAHCDGLALPFLAAAFLMARRKKIVWTGCMIALASLIKPFPLLLLPVFCWHFRWKKGLVLGCTALILFMLAFVPFLDARLLIFKQLSIYSKHWYFNGFTYFILREFFENDVARKILQLATVTLAMVSPFLRGFSLEEKGLFSLTAFLFLTPTLYPWYMTWLLCWLVFSPKKWVFWIVGWISISHSVHYFQQTQKKWVLPYWILALEFLPAYVLIAMDGWRRNKKRKQAFIFSKSP